MNTSTGKMTLRTFKYEIKDTNQIIDQNGFVNTSRGTPWFLRTNSY